MNDLLVAEKWLSHVLKTNGFDFDPSTHEAFTIDMGLRKHPVMMVTRPYALRVLLRMIQSDEFQTELQTKISDPRLLEVLRKVILLKSRLRKIQELKPHHLSRLTMLYNGKELPKPLNQVVEAGSSPSTSEPISSNPVFDVSNTMIETSEKQDVETQSSSDDVEDEPDDVEDESDDVEDEKLESSSDDEDVNTSSQPPVIDIEKGTEQNDPAPSEDMDADSSEEECDDMDDEAVDAAICYICGRGDGEKTMIQCDGRSCKDNVLRINRDTSEIRCGRWCHLGCIHVKIPQNRKTISIGPLLKNLGFISYKKDLPVKTFDKISQKEVIKMMIGDEQMKSVWRCPHCVQLRQKYLNAEKFNFNPYLVSYRFSIGKMYGTVVDAISRGPKSSEFVKVYYENDDSVLWHEFHDENLLYVNQLNMETVQLASHSKVIPKVLSKNDRNRIRYVTAKCKDKHGQTRYLHNFDWTALWLSSPPITENSQWRAEKHVTMLMT